MRLPRFLRPYSAALRFLLLMTAVLGIGYPLAVTAVAQLPGLAARADGSLVTGPGGTLLGSALIGQSFTDQQGHALVQYLQSRPSAAGAGYDPIASGASNLGPESVLDAPGTPGLLTLVCARSKAVGALEQVSGARPFCTPSGVGAVLVVFHTGPGYAGAVTRAVSADEVCPATPFLATYQGVRVACATPGEDLTRGQVVPVYGDAPADPAVPADAVTASGSGLDPEISPAYARLQAPRLAAERRIGVAQVLRIIGEHTAGRDLGFLGEPRVNVLAVNRQLDAEHPYRAG